MIIAGDFSVWDNSVYLADLLEALALLPRSADPPNSFQLAAPCLGAEPPAPPCGSRGPVVKRQHSRPKDTGRKPRSRWPELLPAPLEADCSALTPNANVKLLDAI